MPTDSDPTPLAQGLIDIANRAADDPKLVAAHASSPNPRVMAAVAAIVGELGEVDWDVVQAAVHRSVAEYSRAYFIPANGLFPGLEDKVADTWGELSAPFITACIREDLRKAARADSIEKGGTE